LLIELDIYCDNRHIGRVVANGGAASEVECRPILMRQKNYIIIEERQKIATGSEKRSWHKGLDRLNNY
jgi:hypothetical protein